MTIKEKKVHKPISITNIISVSALGTSKEEVWQSYLTGTPLFKRKNYEDSDIWISALTKEAENFLNQLIEEKPAYKNLDRSVLMAILASKGLFSENRFKGKNIGVNIGSSRGATHLFEKYHEQFLKGEKISPFSSPTTTLGNLSSWVGQELGVSGISIDQSVTCSTAMHAILNGIAWLQADMAHSFLVGGSEAPLTPFTIAQMQSLKLYSKTEGDFPNESMNFKKEKNTMILGEAAAVAVLEKGVSENSLAVIAGYGFASEQLEHNSSISENAICFQKSMKMALEKAELDSVDAIIMHAPGTVKGDIAEKNAIDMVFATDLPLLTSNKWLIGHTFATSGMMSLEMGILMLAHNQFIENPFYKNVCDSDKKLNSVMINAVGFGGNAVSIIITKP